MNHCVAKSDGCTPCRRRCAASFGSCLSIWSCSSSRQPIRSGSPGRYMRRKPSGPSRWANVRKATSGVMYMRSVPATKFIDWQYSTSESCKAYMRRSVRRRSTPGGAAPTPPEPSSDTMPSTMPLLKDDTRDEEAADASESPLECEHDGSRPSLTSSSSSSASDAIICLSSRSLDSSSAGSSSSTISNGSSADTSATTTAPPSASQVPGSSAARPSQPPPGTWAPSSPAGAVRSAPASAVPSPPVPAAPPPVTPPGLPAPGMAPSTPRGLVGSHKKCDGKVRLRSSSIWSTMAGSSSSGGGSATACARSSW
mmetsp:Transcript_26448/g.85425  ORF Transcript_26448/g.85425 Transcript_26448/m.85425 type:complete len:311 (+) Transcript_26448:3245-4177(+)